MLRRLVNNLRRYPRRRSKRRVVISGIGIVSPIGIGKDTFWQSLLAARTGIGKISSLDASSFPSQIAAEVKDFDPEQYLTRRQLKYFARPTQFACAAFKLAKDDAGPLQFDPFRTDVILGTATSEFGEYDRQVFSNPTAGRQYIEGSFDPLVLARIFINGPACAIALEHHLQGLVTTLSSACASSLNAIGVAVQRIEDDRADVAIAGGTDCGVNYFSLNSFCASDSLAVNNEHPEDALCPFDKRRTKSVLGEGAAIFILEELEHALARGATPYGEIVGFAQENENTNELYMLDKTGSKWAHAITRALVQSGKRLDFICAHGPSDAIIDAVEYRALHSVLGNKISAIPLSSIKGSIGSPLGAAGGLQLATAALVIRNQILPPTYNYQLPDPECPFQVIKKPLRRKKIEQVLVNGHGFGGVNVSLVLRDVLL